MKRFIITAHMPAFVVMASFFVGLLTHGWVIGVVAATIAMIAVPSIKVGSIEEGPEEPRQIPASPKTEAKVDQDMDEIDQVIHNLENIGKP